MALSQMAGGMVVVIFLTGCTANFYRKQADKDVYEILSKVEADIFGESKPFSIDTEHSSEKPKEVDQQQILDGRTTSRDKVVLPLDEALNYAVAHNREYQTEKEALYLTALTLTGERYNFFPQIFARSRATGTRQEDGERLGTVSTDIGVTQALLTGADIGISIANDLLRFYTGDPRKSAASVISMNLLQPLLRGAGRAIAGERLKQSHRNVFYAVRDFSHFQNTFAVDVVIEYFRLLQAKEVIFNEYNNYLSRKSDTERLRARSVDRQSLEDVAQSEQSELSAKDNYLSAITRFRNALDRFKITLGMPQTIDLRVDDSELERLRETGLIPLEIGREASFRTALAHRLPLLNEVDRFEDSQRQVVVAADRLKADLNILGDASLGNDEGPTQYEEFDFNNVRASLGVQLNLPLDRLRERNDYRAVLISFERAIRSLGLTFDQLRNLIDQELRELARLRQSYEIQQNAEALAQNRVRGNRLRLEAGTLLFRDLTESQDALIRAQNAVVNALVDYLEARLRFLTDLGILSTEEELFWLKEDALKVDPATWRSFPGEEIITAPMPDSGDVPTPEQVFAE